MKHDLLALLNHLVAYESRIYTTDYDYPPGCRLSAAIKCMRDVRSSEQGWDEIMQLEHSITSQPTCITVREIVESIGTNLKNKLHRGHMIALFAFVTDVCVSKLCGNETIDVQATASSLVDYLVEKHLLTCIEFLKLLDTMPLVDI